MFQETRISPCIDDDDKFDHRICRILAEVLPHTPKKKKAKNKNFNMDEFNKLSLSDDELENTSENNKDSDLGTESEGKEWPHKTIVTVVSRKIHSQFRKKQKPNLEALC